MATNSFTNNQLNELKSLMRNGLLEIMPLIVEEVYGIIPHIVKEISPEILKQTNDVLRTYQKEGKCTPEETSEKHQADFEKFRKTYQAKVDQWLLD